MRLLRTIFLFVKIVIRRLKEDNMTIVAGNLTYKTSLALVPLITVLFFFLAAFPMFAELGEKVKELLFSNLMPAANNNVQIYLEQFISNSNKMTTVGAVGLLATSLLVIRDVDAAINLIWHAKKKRSRFLSFAVYWMILTLGPILLGLSFGISSYIFSQQWTQHYVSSNILRVVPLIFTCVTFWLLYSVVPNRRINVKDSFVAAFVASCLFELAKKLFALYVELFPSYEVIYGVIAAIPMLLLWIYLCWCIVLFGAELGAALETYRKFKERALTERMQLDSDDDDDEEPSYS